MAAIVRLLSHIFIVAVFSGFYLEAQCKIVHKRSLTDVKCLESGRFYRNPDRDEDRIWTIEECAKYYLCLEREVFEFHCTKGLMFDVSRQMCDKQENVHNCELSTEIRTPRPLLENASCANETHLGCANNECILADYFCDGSLDCNDSSDESYCDNHSDPNAAAKCDPIECQLPDCFCSSTGQVIPGNLMPSQTPQMITLTFDGAVNHENWDIYTKHLFTPERRNPNGCETKATFFVTHPYTNYRHVQTLWNEGHEIAVNSITHRGPAEWWAKNATIEEWFDEMVGQANIMNRFANVRMEDFRGLRVPHLSVGWNRQYLMMREFGFVYDATVVAPLSPVPLWPYTLDYKMPHECNRENQICPSRSYPGVWQMVINPITSGNQTCDTFTHCPRVLTAEEVYKTLVDNFKRHYLNNRAPYGIHLNAEWFKNQDYLAAFKKFTNELLKIPDVYFVTYHQLIEWMKRPTPVEHLKKFQPWQCKPKYFEESEIACLQPNTCKLSSRVSEHNKYMITCNECPYSYPWIRNEFGYE